MRYVSVGRRFVALLIDGIVLLIVAAPLAETTRRPGYLRIELVGARSVVPILVWLAYFVAMEGTIGATLGKLAMGIRVTKPDGSKLDAGSALIRNVARFVDGFPYVIPYLVGAIAVWSDGSTRQRLGDRWAHSVVVERSSIPAAPGAWIAGAPNQPAPPPPGETRHASAPTPPGRRRSRRTAPLPCCPSALGRLARTAGEASSQLVTLRRCAGPMSRARSRTTSGSMSSASINARVNR
ncbi:MAG: RDD family protein [Actinomycetota bacterium]